MSTQYVLNKMTTLLFLSQDDHIPVSYSWPLELVPVVVSWLEEKLTL